MRQVRAVLADQFGVPQSEADLPGPAPKTLEFRFELCVREVDANLPSGLGRHFRGIDSMQIPAGRQSLRIAHRIAPAAGRHVGPRQSA